MRIEDKFELTKWLIERYDILRNLIASRATAIITADSILIAASTILLGDVFSLKGPLGAVYCVIILIMLAMGFLVLSVYFAISALASVWGDNRKTLGLKDVPAGIFFRARDSVERKSYGGNNPKGRIEFETFKNKFVNSEIEDLYKYALSELFIIINAQHIRYSSFRWSMRFVVISVVPLVIAFIIVVVLKCQTVGSGPAF